MEKKASAEKVAREIPRKPRRRFSAEGEAIGTLYGASKAPHVIASSRRSRVRMMLPVLAAVHGRALRGLVRPSGSSAGGTSTTRSDRTARWVTDHLHRRMLSRNGHRE